MAWLGWRPAASSRAVAEPQPAAEEPLSCVETAEGRRIYVDPRDGRAAALMRAGGDFNPTTLLMWRNLCTERAWTHVIDVGANYGEMIVGASLPAGAHVVALEPNESLLPALERTLREAGLNVEILAAAASETTGSAMLTIDRDWSGMSSLIAGQEQSAGHAQDVREVATVTLERLVRERARGPVRLLVKIDVETHEVPVLRGLGSLLAELEEFAALVEVLHLSEEDLGWIASRFRVELYDAGRGGLAAVDAADGAALRAVLAGGKYYSLDAVLRRKAGR